MGCREWSTTHRLPRQTWNRIQQPNRVWVRRLIEDIARLTVLHGAPGVSPALYRRSLPPPPRSWVIMIMAVLNSRLSSFNSVMICACTVTSGQWSVHPQSAAGAGTAAPWQSSRADACPGELVREHFHALTRFRHFYRVEHLHRLFKRFGFLLQPFMQHQDFH